MIESNLAPHSEGGRTWWPDPEVLRAHGQAFQIDEATSAGLVRQVGCPTLLIRAAESQYVAHEQAKRTDRALRNGNLVEIPECGHGIAWEQPERLLDAARSFLIEIPAESRVHERSPAFTPPFTAVYRHVHAVALQ